MMKSRYAALRFPLHQVRPRIRGAGPTAGSAAALSGMSKYRDREAPVRIRPPHRGAPQGRGARFAAAADQGKQGQAGGRGGISEGARGALTLSRAIKN